MGGRIAFFRAATEDESCDRTRYCSAIRRHRGTKTQPLFAQGNSISTLTRIWQFQQRTTSILMARNCSRDVYIHSKEKVRSAMCFTILSSNSHNFAKEKPLGAPQNISSPCSHQYASKKTSSRAQHARVYLTYLASPAARYKPRIALHALRNPC